MAQIEVEQEMGAPHYKPVEYTTPKALIKFHFAAPMRLLDKAENWTDIVNALYEIAYAIEQSKKLLTKLLSPLREEKKWKRKKRK